MKKRLFRTLQVILGLIVLAFTALWLWPSGPPSSEVFKTPDSNAYRELVRLGEKLERVDSQEMQKKRLQEFVTSNSNVLAQVTRKLGRPCAVPVEFTADYSNAKALSALRNVGATLEAKARLAAILEEHTRASEIYLDLIRFGHAVTRNGLLIDYSVGGGEMTAGYLGLQDLIQNLSKDRCLHIIEEIQTLESRRETVTDILKRERAWADEVHPVRHTLFRILNPSFRKKKIQSIYKETRRPVAPTLKMLATRAYELEHGKAPPSLQALVPKYLNEIPEPSKNSSGATNAKR